MITLIVLALANNSILMSFYKWRLMERYDLHKRRWMPEWCDFCFFFWAGMIEEILLRSDLPLGFSWFALNFIFALAEAFIANLINQYYHEDH